KLRKLQEQDKVDGSGNERPRNNQSVDHEKENVSARQQECAARRERWRHSSNRTNATHTQPDGDNNDCRSIEAACQCKGKERRDHQSVTGDLKIPLHRKESLTTASVAGGFSAAPEICTKARYSRIDSSDSLCHSSDTKFTSMPSWIR